MKSNVSPGSFFTLDSNGMTTPYSIGIKKASVAFYSLVGTGAMKSDTEIDGTVDVVTPLLKMTPSGAPASTEGYFYYDSAAHKLKIRGAAGFETVTSI